MLVIFVRSIILYIIILIVMRLMGKREIGQLQPFELVIAIMIADLASVPMSDTGIPLYNGIIPILALLLFLITIIQYLLFYIGVSNTTGVKATVISGSNSFFQYFAQRLFSVRKS